MGKRDALAPFAGIFKNVDFLKIRSLCMKHYVAQLSPTLLTAASAE